MRVRRSCILVGVTMLGAATPPPSRAVDITSELTFSDIKNCVVSPAAEKIFDGLLKQDKHGKAFVTQPRLRIGGTDLATRRTVTPKEDIEKGAKIFEGEVSLPPSARWRGLSITRIGSRTSNYTEVDNFNEIYLTFREPPSTVAAALRRIGIKIPTAPQYLEIDDGACGGAMSLSKLKDGTLLSCNWGC